MASSVRVNALETLSPASFSRAKPSRLITNALVCLAKTERDPTYIIDANEWHTPVKRLGKCRVNLAGMTLAFSFMMNPKEHAAPPFRGQYISSTQTYRLYGLWHLHHGRTKNASMYFNHPNKFLTLEVLFNLKTPYIKYEVDPEGFKTYLRACAEAFKTVET